MITASLGGSSSDSTLACCSASSRRERRRPVRLGDRVQLRQAIEEDLLFRRRVPVDHDLMDEFRHAGGHCTGRIRFRNDQISQHGYDLR